MAKDFGCIMEWPIQEVILAFLLFEKQREGEKTLEEKNKEKKPKEKRLQRPFYYLICIIGKAINVLTLFV